MEILFLFTAVIGALMSGFFIISTIAMVVQFLRGKKQ